jgi:hypothetical protein
MWILRLLLYAGTTRRGLARALGSARIARGPQPRTRPTTLHSADVVFGNEKHNAAAETTLTTAAAPERAWLNATNECRWYDIQCVNRAVTAIQLDSSSINSVQPADLALLTGLERSKLLVCLVPYHRPMAQGLVWNNLWPSMP